MYLEKPIEELMKLIEESGYSTYASWKIQHEMEEAKRLYDYLIEVQGYRMKKPLKGYVRCGGTVLFVST